MTAGHNWRRSRTEELGKPPRGRQPGAARARQPTIPREPAPRSNANGAGCHSESVRFRRVDADGDLAMAVSRPPRLGPRGVRVELGLVAFAPAMALLAYRSRHESLWWLCFAVPAALGCVFAIGAVAVVRRTSSEPFTFTEIGDAGDEVLGHVGSYLLPVVVDVSRSFEEIVVAGIALALIVQIHVATGRVHVNPLLYLFGYRAYRATTDTGVTYYLIAHSDPAEWSPIHQCAPLGSSVLVERRREARPSLPTSRRTME